MKQLSKKLLGIIALVGINSVVFAQVKIGANPTVIPSTKYLDVEATSGKHVSVNKTDGKMYIENKPAALATDSVVMRYIDGEIRQMSISRLSSLTNIKCQIDTDGDGIPDCTDPDIDGDGILNAADACPAQYGCASTNAAKNGCPSACGGGGNPDPAAVSTWKASNFVCSNATISASGCASLSGAILNDDPSTSPGIEYDWGPGASSTIGVGFGAPSGTRVLVEIGGQCWARYDNNIAATAASANNIVVGEQNSATFVSGKPVYLYSFYSAMNTLSPTERGQGVCPNGFHVPSECEWIYLTNSLGLSIVEQLSTGDSQRLINFTPTGFALIPNAVNSWSYYYTSTAWGYQLNFEDGRVTPYPHASFVSINANGTNRIDRERNPGSFNNADLGTRKAIRCLRD